MQGVTEQGAVRALIASVVKQTIDNWEGLDNGNLRCVRLDGSTIYRDEVLTFLRSNEFDAMCKYAMGISKERVLEVLQIDEELSRKVKLSRSEFGALKALAKHSMNVSEAAKELGISRNYLYVVLQRIESETGIDPMDFYGLHSLLEQEDS